MKKFFTLFFILLTFSAYAQEQSKAGKKVSPWSLGVSGFGYVSTFNNYILNDTLGAGGGVGLKFKGNINRFIGFATEFNYTNTSRSYSLSSGGFTPNINVLDLTSHIIDIRESLVVQYETYKGENGFVPWLSIGAGATIYVPEYSIIGVSNTGDFTAVGFNFNVAAGLKYNYKHFYTGLYVDYTKSIAYTDTVTFGSRSTNAIDPDGVRFGLELGFRY